MNSLLNDAELTRTDYQGTHYTSGQVQKRVVQLAFCLTDEKGYFVEVNNAYCELYGYAESELIGKHFSKVVPAENQEFAARMHDEFILGAVEMPAEWTVKAKSGQLLRVFVSALRLESPDSGVQKLTILEFLGPAA